MRGYITGSCWKAYSQGKREFCGIILEENLKENEKFKEPIITPTTKGEHDYPISIQEIIESNILSETQVQYIAEKCIELYKEGSRICEEKGLILVDTKYEFGLDEQKKIYLIDEIHTPDSSRFRIKKSYNRILFHN